MPHRLPERAARVLQAPALRFAALSLLFFLLEIAAHAPLLRLPYFWDEAGYYIPAAYDFLRTGTLIPFSTLSNAHPPGLSLYLASAWRLFGFSPATTRVSLCLPAAVALAAVCELTLVELRSRAAAAAVVLLTACYPVFFVQSTLAHADMLACAFSLSGLLFALGRKRSLSQASAAAGCFALAALTKEIAIGTPLALAAWEAGLLVRCRGGSWARLAALGSPAVPLAAWFGYHRRQTGFFFGNPGYLRYNATATLSSERVLLALAHRALHLTAHLNLFVPVAVALGCLLLPPVGGRARMEPAVRNQLWVVIVANALLFSFLGGALLTRYLLPEYPLVLLLAIASVYRHQRRWLWLPALSCAAFLAALLLPPPYRIAPEDTLLYRDAVVLEQAAIAVVTRDYPHGTVLTAWPVSDALRKPELGYVHAPVPVLAIDNFALPALQQLAASGQSYETAILFSTKYEPSSVSFALPGWNQRADERYFGLHHDLSAGAVAVLLGGTVVWHEQRAGQWAAVLRFAHPQLATLKEDHGGERPSYNQK